MKKMKKLFPALCLLLVSATLLGTSTYAWFSMNKEVTASNMSITAKSDSVYLLISNNEDSTTAAAIQAENNNNGNTKVTATLVGDAVNVYPSALATKATKDGVKKNTIDDYSLAASWYKSNAATANAATSVSDKEVALTTLNGYVIHYTYKFTLAKGSEKAENLKVNKITVTPNTSDNADSTIAPVSILVVNKNDQTKVAELKLEGQNIQDGKYTITDTTSLVDELTDTNVAELDVYVYYDGNNEKVYTNNKANLDGCSFEMEFGVD